MSAQNWERQIIAPGDSAELPAKAFLEESFVFVRLSADTIHVPYSIRGSNPAYLVFEPPLEDTIYWTYQTFDLKLKSRFSLRDSSLILPPLRKGQTLNPEDLYQAEEVGFSPFNRLNSQGSISRSVAVGNNQDAVLNSALNLQLSGNLGNQTTIRASISDNTVPIQAQGYTQQLRDFDRVYLEIENPDFGKLRAGDYNIRSNNHFLRLEKRISGAGISTRFRSGESQYQVDLEGGLARGRFARNRFQGEEGNQGPYKLRGANGEQFIIIISGSERVYIDGVLQKRGQQFDYIIDYNAGEISFTALQPITRDKRIVVEFQYTEQNFLRSVAQGAVAWQKSNWESEVRYYTEQDSKDQPISTDYSDNEKALLALVGDDLERAQASTIFPSDFNPALVQYRLVDSLGMDSVLVFSADSTRALYNASFSFVGINKGDYQLAQSNANGRVFKWVAPVDGVPQGSYAPVRTLIAPNRLQVLSYSTRGNWGQENRQSLAVEGAFSNNQLNLFSDRDRSNDDGAAAKFEYQLKRNLSKGELILRTVYEFNNPGFTTLERIRPVEFARDWNLPFNYQGALQNGQLGLSYLIDSSLVALSFEFLNSPIKQGWRQGLRTNWQSQKWLGDLNFSLTETQGLDRQESFWREQVASRYYWLPKLWLGFASVGEWNRKRFGNDSLTANSYSFLEYQLFQGWGDTSKTFTEIGFLQRYDDSVRTGKLEPFAYAYTSFLRGAWQNQYRGRLAYKIYYRSLKIQAPEDLSLQRTLTSRLNYNQPFLNRAVISQTFYESGSGTEPRRSFTYVEVPPGTGTHTHVDYNGNGVRELDEFELAPTPDLANFVRIFSPNLEFVRTSSVKFGQNLNVQAPAQWQSTELNWKKFLRRFSVITAYQLERRSLLLGGLNELNPFDELSNDSILVAQNNSFRQTLFFNRSSLIFGGDYTFSRNDNRNLLSFGIEERSLEEHRLNLRYGFWEHFVLRYGGRYQDKLNRSGNFTQRNYDLAALQHEGVLSYQANSSFTLSLSYLYRSEESIGTYSNSLIGQVAGLELNYNVAQNIALRSELDFIYNDFKGVQNSPAAFEMLQAFKPGRNLGAQVGVQRTLLKNIVISLNYNGRFSEGLSAIHTGNVQVKAFF